ncbi:LysE/ArgO family amino acid transporter [Nocardioides perillae]|uniref:L-lysine exporter family protein LysE/ArgO n=1 Tax=Nocardioides perillae TaxID=1119534 RepID=A0A7Y9RSD4_9ACTN|nr:L-lysine exporter family protein LysE/ArgO [Nocardioides perillae]
MTTSLLAGLAAGLTLIVAIGAQNAFVLRQGLARHHVGAVVAVCALSDAALIVAGVAGTGAVVERYPGAVEVVRWGGVAFLAAYAVLSLRRAWRGGGVLDAGPAPRSGRTLAVVVGQAVALTWLNPHVYLDTVLLLGSLAQQQPVRWGFAAGAVAASLLWFAGLGFGARLLSPVFARPGAWRVLDTVVGLTMAALAVALARG